MIRKKICMLGAFAVGKTSLVRRFVHTLYSDDYHTTMGVKVDKKLVRCEGQDVTMMLWDIHGEDRFQTVRSSYTRGAAGCLYVVDPTRPDTPDVAIDLADRLEEREGQLPRLLVLNKHDLQADWALDAQSIRGLEGEGWTVVRSSAKTDEGVEEAFSLLARMLMAHDA